MTKKLRLKKIGLYGRQENGRFFQFDQQPHLGGNVVCGDKMTFYPEMWSWLVRELGIRSVLDVGCAEGIHTKYFKELGCEIIGVEGLLLNAIHPQAAFPIIINDFQESFVQVAKIDLAWCCEVLEHIEEAYLDNVMQTLLNGKYITITHALPGQGGHHHVNEQSPEYWIARFEEYNCILQKELTLQTRKRAHSWYQQSGMVFLNMNWDSMNNYAKVKSLLASTKSQILEAVFARLNSHVKTWIKKKLAIAVYGAGQHTDVLSRNTDLFSSNLVCVVDRNSSIAAKHFQVPLVLPHQLPWFNPDLIVISSAAFQEEIASQLADQGIQSENIFRLYTDNELEAAQRDLHLYL